MTYPVASTSISKLSNTAALPYCDTSKRVAVVGKHPHSPPSHLPNRESHASPHKTFSEGIQHPPPCHSLEQLHVPAAEHEPWPEQVSLETVQLVEQVTLETLQDVALAEHDALAGHGTHGSGSIVGQFACRLGSLRTRTETVLKRLLETGGGRADGRGYGGTS
eukprot:2388769-Rhodomonas_salina.1